jgi:hypothetical protein
VKCYFNAKSPNFKGNPSLLSLRERSQHLCFGGVSQPPITPSQRWLPPKVPANVPYIPPPLFTRGGNMFGGNKVPASFTPQNAFKDVPEMRLIKVNGQPQFVPASMVRDE